MARKLLYCPRCKKKGVGPPHRIDVYGEYKLARYCRYCGATLHYKDRALKELNNMALSEDDEVRKGS